MSNINLAIRLANYLKEQQRMVSAKELMEHCNCSLVEVELSRKQLVEAGIEIDSSNEGAYAFKGYDNPLMKQLSSLDETTLGLFETIGSIAKVIKQLREEKLIDESTDSESLRKLVMIQYAITNSRILDIVYLSKRGEVPYLVEPYFIRMMNEFPYLQAAFRQVLKLYRLDRITKLTLTPDVFVLDKTLYEEKKSEETLIANKKQTTSQLFRLEVIGPLNQYVPSFFEGKGEILNHTDTIVDGKTTKVVYEIKTMNLEDALYVILSLGTNATVLDHKKLKAMVASETKIMKLR